MNALFIEQGKTTLAFPIAPEIRPSEKRHHRRL
jgi:hypothetical protein